MKLQTLINLFLLFCSCFISNYAVSSGEWQHDNPNFDRSGQVTIKNLAGVSTSLSNNGQQGLQSSASPVVLYAASGGDYSFDLGFLLSTGEYLVREENLNSWLKFRKDEFEYQFTIEESAGLNALPYAPLSRTSAQYTAGGSGSASKFDDWAITAHVTCQLGNQHDSVSSGYNASTWLIDSEASAYCSALSNVNSVHIDGTLYIKATVKYGIYNATNDCSYVFMAHQTSTNCEVACSGSASGSVTASCTAVDIGYATTIGGRAYGFTAVNHYSLNGVTANKERIKMTGISAAYVDPASNMFFIQRGVNFFYIDPNSGFEALIAQLAAGEVPKKMLKGLKFTKRAGIDHMPPSGHIKSISSQFSPPPPPSTKIGGL